MRKLVMITISCGISTQFAIAQHPTSSKGKVLAGMGAGLPYGGIVGIQMGYNPLNQTSLFVSGGYNLGGLGYNVGAKYIIPSDNHLTELYFTAMYGTNTSSKIEGWNEYTKNYYGTSFGAGLRINARRNESVCWDVGILIPSRSSDYHDTIEEIKDNSFEDFHEPWPVLLYVGFDFFLKSH